MAGIIEPPRLAEDADRTGIEWNGSGRLREAGAMTVVVLRVFALLSGLMAAGIVVVEAHSAVYPQIADRIWKNQPYQPDVIIGALKETSRLCVSGHNPEQYDRRDHHDPVRLHVRDPGRR